jgi:hypothetical protein
MLFWTGGSLAQSGSSNTDFGSVNIGTTSSSVPVTLTFTATGTLGNMAELTSGATGLDFASAAGGTCTTGSSYSVGDTCTVSVTFTPTLPGTRFGAIVLQDGSGIVMAISYLQGTGTGPEVGFLPSTEKGIPTSALSIPLGIAVDGNGDLFVADYGNNRVLKETLSGGSYAESVISTSPLSGPRGLAVDGRGNLYIADTGNNRILKEMPTGSGYSESTIPTSPLSAPCGVAIDGSGNVFIADWGNNRILEETWLTTGYTESTVSTSTLNSPTEVAVDGSGPSILRTLTIRES